MEISQPAIKAGYKQTDVGIIPEDWDVEPIGNILQNSRLGGNYPNQDIESSHPLIKMGNIGRGFIDLDKVEYIPNYFKPSEKDKLRFGDVLFNTRNTLDLVGKVAIWRNELPLAFYNSNLLRLEFSPKHVSSNFFINYIFNTNQSLSQLKGFATGTTSVAAIYTRDLLKFKIPLPPLPEQQAIAEVLSDVDALITSLDQLITKKRNIKQGTMQLLLTGKKRLADFSGDWETKKLGEVGDCIRGVSYNGDRDLLAHDAATTFRLFRSNNVQNSKIDFSGLQFVSQKRVKPIQLMQSEDVLICMANGSKELVGKSALFHSVDSYQYTFGAFMGCYRVFSKEADNKFIFYNFHSYNYRSYIDILLSGSSINNLKPSDIESIKIPFPQIEEQKAIAQILSDMDAEIEALERKREKYKAIKQGMMQELLTGKTRLVKPATKGEISA